MKRMIFTGAAILTAGLSGLLAQQPAAAPPAAAPGAATTTPLAKQPTVKSKAEGQAVVAVQKATDPDAVIKAAEDLINKFADTEFKEFALTMEAKAYQQKGDDLNAQVYAERVLEINPKSYTMQLLIGELIAPKIQEHDLNHDEEVAKATKMFNDSIANVTAAPKPNPQISDKDWADAQKYSVAEAHNGLGILAQVQRHWPDAVKEYQLAYDEDPDQDAYATRLANALLATGKNDQALAICDKLLAKPDLNPRIKQVVTQVRTLAAKK